MAVSSLIITGYLTGPTQPRAETSLLTFFVYVGQTCPHNYILDDECRGKPPISRVGFIVRVDEIDEHAGADAEILNALVDARSLRLHPCRFSRGGNSRPAVHNANQIAHLDLQGDRFPTRVVGNEHRLCSGRKKSRENQSQCEACWDHVIASIQRLETSGRGSEKPVYAPVDLMSCPLFQGVKATR